MMSTSIAKLIHASMRLTRALTVSDDFRGRLPRWRRGGRESEPLKGYISIRSGSHMGTWYDRYERKAPASIAAIPLVQRRRVTAGVVGWLARV